MEEHLPIEHSLSKVPMGIPVSWSKEYKLTKKGWECGLVENF
jgi:hypothetical protein